MKASPDSSIIDSIGRWPFPALHEHKSENDWFEISKDHADQLIGAVPPIYIPGGFMVGEAQTIDRRGVSVYTAIIHIGYRYFARDLPIDQKREARNLAMEAIGSRGKRKACRNDAGA